MVEVMEHLRLVEGEVLRAGLVWEDPAVVGHIEHPKERQAPQVAVLTLRLVHQHRHATVDRLGQLRVTAAAECWAGPRVWIEQGEIGRRQREVALGFREMLDRSGEE